MKLPPHKFACSTSCRRLKGTTVQYDILSWNSISELKTNCRTQDTRALHYRTNAFPCNAPKSYHILPLAGLHCVGSIAFESRTHWTHTRVYWSRPNFPWGGVLWKDSNLRGWLLIIVLLFKFPSTSLSFKCPSSPTDRSAVWEPAILYGWKNKAATTSAWRPHKVRRFINYVNRHTATT